jgi:mycothiol system anti-sigma-R factor
MTRNDPPNETPDHADGDCSDALHELYEYLDGELTEDRRTVIAEHLTACGECFEAFDFQAELKVVIAHKCRDEVPDALKARVASLLEGEA